jgi:bifunctional non-homologous end joining protein LigD
LPDTLRLDGDDVRRLPLSELQEQIGKAAVRRSRDGIKYVEHLEADGDEVFEAAVMLGLEGIVCKRRTASYKSGSCKSWIKVRNRSRQRTCGSLTELSKELSPLP